MNLLGWLDGHMVHMTYTERNGELRAISLRRATKYGLDHNSGHPRHAATGVR